MKTYAVRARRRDGGWDLDIKGVGVTRCERLTAAENAVRRQLDVLGFSDAGTAAVAFEYAADLEREVQAVREGRASADAANRFAAERTRELATRLVSEGYRGAEIAMIMGISPQRVSQIVAAPEPPRSAKAARTGTTPEASEAAEVDVRTKEEKAAAKERKKAKARKKAGKPDRRPS